MNCVGIVAEFNPFHAGHKYLIDAVKAAGAKKIISVMSGNFVQRCEPAFFEKHIRARVAVKNGVDVVVALPLRYSIGSAEKFASGATEILKACGVDTIAFGSECGSTETLKRIAEDALRADGSDEFKKALSSGMSFAAARQIAVESSGGVISSLPNDILASEYIKASIKNNYAFDFFTIKRSDGYLQSAGRIRESVLAGNTNGLDGLFVNEIEKNTAPASVKNIEKAVLAFLRNAAESTFENIYGINPLEGIPQRLIKAARETSLDDVYAAVKSKRIAYSAVRRAVWNAFFGIGPTEDKIPYLQILAASDTGKKEIKRIAEHSGLPVVLNLSKLRNTPGCKKFVDEERRATDIYNLSLPETKKGMTEFTDKISL